MIRALLALFLATLPVQAATINAASTSRADVQTAITAAVTGDTVSIPVGISDWGNNGIAVSGKNIWVIGSGTNIGSSTIISNGYFNFGTTTFRASALKMVRMPATTADFAIRAQGAGWRVDHCWLESGNSVKSLGVYPMGQSGTTKPPNGVIDHCTFYQCRVNVEGDTSSGFGWNSTEWTDPLAMDRTNQVVIEDCTLQRTVDNGFNVVDAEYGGSYTVRFCTIIDGNVFSHGDYSANGTGERGTRFVSVYGNTFIASGALNMNQAGAVPMWFRAGSGNLYSNNMTGTWTTHQMTFDDEAGINDITGGATNGTDGNYPYGAYGSGTHTGSNGASTLTSATASWTVNELVTAKVVAPNGGASISTNLHVHNLTDGSHGRITANTATTITATLTGGSRNNWNTGDSYVVTGGYPTRDQVGTVSDVSQWNGVSVVRPAQNLRPFYYWANKRSGTNNNIVAIGGPYFIQDGRDITNAVPADFAQMVYPHQLVTAQDGGGGGGSSGGGGGTSPPVEVNPRTSVSGQVTASGNVIFQ